MSVLQSRSSWMSVAWDGENQRRIVCSNDYVTRIFPDTHDTNILQHHDLCSISQNSHIVECKEFWTFRNRFAHWNLTSTVSLNFIWECPCFVHHVLNPGSVAVHRSSRQLLSRKTLWNEGFPPIDSVLKVASRINIHKSNDRSYRFSSLRKHGQHKVNSNLRL